MTDAEWLASDDPNRLIEHLCGRRIYHRKLLLCLCSCCRQVWDLMPDERSREAVRIAELYADRKASWSKFLSVTDAARDAIHSPRPGVDDHLRCVLVSVADAAWRIRSVPLWKEHDCALNMILRRTSYVDPTDTLRAVHRVRQVALIRDIFGIPYPFPQSAFAPEWRTDTAVSLGRAMYDSCDFGTMPILADALQDAGCNNDDILEHCRDPHATHVRGCWVVDRVLGKE